MTPEQEMTKFDKLRPAIAPVMAAVVAALIAGLARHGFEVKLDETARGTLTDVGVSFVLGVFGVVFGALNKGIAVFTNPTNSASPSLARVASGKTGRKKRSRLATAMEHAATTEHAVPNATLKVTPRDESVVTAGAELDPSDFAPRNPTIGPSGITSRPKGEGFRPDEVTAEHAVPLQTSWPEPPEDEAPPAKKPAKPRTPRKKKAPTDVVKLRRSTDKPPQFSEGDPRGFADYVPTSPDLPKNISPRPKLTTDDKGVL